MSKALTFLTHAAFAATLCVPPASAQSPAWVEVAPADGGFVARMPVQPRVSPAQAQAGGLSVTGRRYEASGEGGTAFLVWTLKDDGGPRPKPGAADNAGKGSDAESAYLDQVAEIAWELLVTPEFERLKKADPVEADGAYTGMVYRDTFELDGRTARAYFLALTARQGPVYVCAEGGRVYVVAALGGDASDPELERFTRSFALTKGAAGGLPAPYTLIYRPGADGARAALPKPARMAVAPTDTPPPSIPARPAPSPASGGGGAPVDKDRPFRAGEVSKKAVVTYKPDPGATPSARKFLVTGTVRLRAILAASGEVTDIHVVNGLPHGLTEMALGAARRIRFEPAQKDGRAVSQYVLLDYHYSIF